MVSSRKRGRRAPRPPNPGRASRLPSDLHSFTQLIVTGHPRCSMPRPGPGSGLGQRSQHPQTRHMESPCSLGGADSPLPGHGPHQPQPTGKTGCAVFIISSAQTELPTHVDLKETRNLRSHWQSETILPREAPAEAADGSPKSQPRCCSESLGAWRRRAGVWTPGLGTLGPAAPTPTAGEGMAGLLRPQDPQGCLRERGVGWGRAGKQARAPQMPGKTSKVT